MHCGKNLFKNKINRPMAKAIIWFFILFIFLNVILAKILFVSYLIKFEDIWLWIGNWSSRRLLQ